jgi:hypothetical protein
MSFPIIDSLSVWENWDNFGSGAWNMWFMAPYGSWMYCGFVKSNVSYFRRVDIGTDDANYDIYSWDFGTVSNTPEDQFPYEQHDGYPNGSMGMGCIRVSGSTPKLYLAGRSSAIATVDDSVIHRFLVDDGFEREDLNYLAPTISASPVSVDHIAGIEVDPTNAVYIVTNNNDATEFQLHRYAYAGFDGAAHDPSHSADLSDQFMEDNTSARIRGIGRAIDGNVLVFINTGLSATETKVLKFDKDNLDYLGTTDWEISISTSTWAYLVQNGEVFLHFQGLDSPSLYDWKNAVYYDRATGIPNRDKSNLIIEENLTVYGSDDPIAMEYHAKDAFNIDVVGANTKFWIDGEDPDDPGTWTDRVGAIKDVSTGDFFDGNGVPLSISAIVATDGNGIATAYYKPMRTGTGTERDAINIRCPSDN